MLVHLIKDNNVESKKQLDKLSNKDVYVHGSSSIQFNSIEWKKNALPVFSMDRLFRNRMFQIGMHLYRFCCNSEGM